MGTYELDEQTILIPVGDIRVGVNITNIRTHFDEGKIKELAEGIYEDSLLNPLVVMQAQDKDGRDIVELVCGARRLRAIQWIHENLDEQFGDGEVKCTQFTGTVEDAALLNGTENIEREDVDPVDEAAWLHRMVEENGHTQEYLAKRMHRHPSWVSARLLIHRKGTDNLKAALREGLFGVTVAYELAKRLSAVEQDSKVAKARKNAEKLTAEDVEVAADVNKVKKPGKKKLGELLSKAEQATANPAKRYAHGVAMGLRWVCGLAGEDEVLRTIDYEGDPLASDHPAAEDADTERQDDAPVEDPKPARRSRKKASENENGDGGRLAGKPRARKKAGA